MVTDPDFKKLGPGYGFINSSDPNTDFETALIRIGFFFTFRSDQKDRIQIQLISARVHNPSFRSH